MKSFIFIAIAFALILSTSALAQVSNCPADRAADKGFDPFGEFHHIMAPVWHEAWPAKDYDAMIAAGPQFETAFEKIAAMKPEFKSERRKLKFSQLREEFASLVDKFAEAARRNDKETVYELMPDLHDSFEMTASSLLPVHYPEFEGVIITLNLIRESHLPANNIDGITGSTETLVTKMSVLNEETIPQELSDVKQAVLTDLEAVKKLVTQMKECCDKKDMEKLSQHAEELNNLLSEFAIKYI